MADILIDAPLEGVKRLTLNRPEAMNAFTFAMYREFVAILEDIRLDPKVRVVILTATGPWLLHRARPEGGRRSPTGSIRRRPSPTARNTPWRS